MSNGMKAYGNALTWPACLGLLFAASLMADRSVAGQSCVPITRAHLSDIEARAAVPEAAISLEASCSPDQCKISVKLDSKIIYEKSSQADAPIQFCEIRRSAPLNTDGLPADRALRCKYQINTVSFFIGDPDGEYDAIWIKYSPDEGFDARRCIEPEHPQLTAESGPPPEFFTYYTPRAKVSAMINVTE